MALDKETNNTGTCVDCFKNHCRCDFKNALSQNNELRTESPRDSREGRNEDNDSEREEELESQVSMSDLKSAYTENKEIQQLENSDKPKQEPTQYYLPDNESRTDYVEGRCEEQVTYRKERSNTLVSADGMLNTNNESCGIEEASPLKSGESQPSAGQIANELVTGKPDRVNEQFSLELNNVQESSSSVFTSDEKKSIHNEESIAQTGDPIQGQDSKWALPRGHVSDYQGLRAKSFCEHDLLEYEHRGITHSETSPDLAAKGRPSVLSRDDAYDFTYPKRGVMVVIVNTTFPKDSPYSDRDGSKADIDYIRLFARNFGFRLFNYCEDKNLSLRKVMEILNKARWYDHTNFDCFSLFISTHGHERRNPEAGGRMEHALVCADGKDIFTSTITNMFNDEHCPSLKGKPKLFFVQACRGDGVDKGCDIQVTRPSGASDVVSCNEDDFIDIRGGRQVDEADARPTDDDRPTNDACAARPIDDIFVDQETGTGTNIRLLYTREASITNTGEQIEQTANLNSEASIRQLGSCNPDRQITTEVDEPTPALQCHIDQLVVYAIPPGMKAWRHTRTGSWMIRYLHCATENYDLNNPKSFLSVLTKVNNRMSHGSTKGEECGLKAVSVIEHKLTKDIIFKKKQHC